MKIGIVGYGIVGRSLEILFCNAGFEVVIYDKYKPGYDDLELRQRINAQCECVFVAVTTPTKAEGCDLTAVHEVVHWVTRPMCVKSTIPPGTVDRLVKETGKEIVFSPEYIGESPFHPYRNGVGPDLVVVGGDRRVAQQFVVLYKLALGPIPHYFLTDATTAELAKYMENCFLATKIAFVAQFYLLAKQFGADFEEMREIWVADKRIGRSHSTVVGQLGFGGRCLPKDLAALIKAAEPYNGAPLLEAVQRFNDSIRSSHVKTPPVAGTVGD